MVQFHEEPRTAYSAGVPRHDDTPRFRQSARGTVAVY